MAYTKNTWRTGDIVSSQKLNHMEDGIANAEQLFVITATLGEGSITADKTATDVYDALNSGKVPVIKIVMNENVVGMAYYAGTYEASEETRHLFMTCAITGSGSVMEAYSLDNNGGVTRIGENA